MASFSTVERKTERDKTWASYISNGIGSYFSNNMPTIYMVPLHHITGLSKAKLWTLIHTKSIFQLISQGLEIKDLILLNQV